MLFPEGIVGEMKFKVSYVILGNLNINNYRYFILHSIPLSARKVYTYFPTYYDIAK